MNTQKTYRGDDLKGKNVSGKDFSDCVFENCDLTNTIFEGCILDGATFQQCISNPQNGGKTNFSNASLQRTIWQGCKFENANLNDADLNSAKIRNTEFKWATARNSHWDESRLDNVDFSMVDFDLASFRNVKVLRVNFRPARETRSRHFLKLLRGRKVRKHTIFTSGTELSPFIEYCSREYRLSQLILEIEQLPRVRKILSTAFIIIIGLVSDFGHSLTRWLGSSLAIITSFSIYFNFFQGQNFESYKQAWHHALVNFINLGELSPVTFTGSSQTALNVIGYFMLGILISIITNRFVSRW